MGGISFSPLKSHRDECTGAQSDGHVCGHGGGYAWHATCPSPALVNVVDDGKG